jgi:anti-sigma regulatory factor (Ser/Thr protein kinase)
LRRRGTDLDVEVVDSGRPFDPTDALDRSSPKSLESAPIGGLGLNLLRSLASKITYRHDGDHNRLRFHIANVAT